MSSHSGLASPFAAHLDGMGLFLSIKCPGQGIPLGVTHGLDNTTNKPLEIIEVQSGTYLGEDDIVRFQDIYGRIKEN